MNFSKLTVSARLAIGFGSILVMLLMMIGVVYYEFSGISKISERIVQKDFAKVIAASKINELSRSNARYTLELFVVQDKAGSKKIFDEIDNNGKEIVEQFAILDKLVYTDKGKADMAEMKDKRAKYSKSYHEAIDLLFQDKRDEATKLLLSDSLPKLNELLAINDDFSGWSAPLADGTTVAFLPQVLRVWRSRSARDISLPMYALFVTGVGFWVVYGVLIQSPPVILANVVTFLLSSAVLVAKLRFG